MMLLLLLLLLLYTAVLTASFVDCSHQQFSPNVVVSKGDGNFTTITGAIKAIPSSDQRRHVIYIKDGIYEENVAISRSEVTLVGDGNGKKTIIRSQLNYGVEKVTILDYGALLYQIISKQDAFLSRMTSGKEKGQAVALRSDGDKSVFFLCEFLGYQDPPSKWAGGNSSGSATYMELLISSVETPLWCFRSAISIFETLAS